MARDDTVSISTARGEIAQERHVYHAREDHSQKVRRAMGRLGNYALMLFFVVLMASPLAWMFISSVKTNQEATAYPPTILPESPTLDAYRDLFTVSDFGTYLRNSVIVSVVATVAVIVIALFAAYALSRFNFRLLRGLGEISLFAYMVPPILLLVPIARIVTNLGLANNLFALVLLYTATQLPFGLWILRSYINGIAIDLEQAAMVDGATRFMAFRHVVVPQTLPGIISTAVFTFNASWSEYLFASTLMTSPSRLTLSPGLTLLLDQTGVYSWSMLMAGSVVVVLPVIALFIIVQKGLVSGMGEGAVKG
ncbi:MAG: carbohydrate ABC transporter permease [Chloroflexota bacterium]|nr:carbohydrate ABC transporter permease [Chloroflexota bacterium]